MKKILIFLILTLNIYAIEPVEELFIPWGEAVSDVAFRNEPAARFGPQSFKINNNSIMVLDPVHQSLKTFTNGKFAGSQFAPATAQNFHVAGEQKINFNVGSEIHRYEYGKLTAIQSLSSLANTQLNKSTNEPVQVKLLSKNSAEIFLHDSEMLLHFDENNLASLRYIGRDRYNRIYIDVNLYTQQVPLKVNRQIMILDSTGKKRGLIELPDHYFTYIHHDIELSSSGTIYHMLSSTDGIHIFRWEIPASNELLNGTYAEKFQKPVRFHTDLESQGAYNRFVPFTVTEKVTRERTLEIADTYVQHEWTCEEKNLTNGVITDPDGDKVMTADWIQIGANQRIPYKWGGFDQLTKFDSGLENGDYAGDTYTDGDVGSNYARGVDCSGYVSRCWQLPSQISTRMMDDPAYGAIVQKYTSWDDLKPGDAIHRHGHVILFVKHNDNGSLQCVEAAASTTDWKVDYTVHYPYGLSDYSPVFYKNMEGAAIPSPQNFTLQTEGANEISIQFDPVSEAGQYIIYFGTDRNELSDSVTTFTNSAVISGLETATVYYFNIKAKNENSESIFYNDIFAAATSDNPHKTLIVNGFDRSSNTRHDYITKYAGPMVQNDYGFSYTHNESVYSGRISLLNYETVIWMLGDESSADDTFNSTEQDFVEEFLRQGGNLLVTGSEIGWDLEGKSNHATQADKNFYHNFLKASYYQDAPGNEKGKYYTVEPTENSIFQVLGQFNFDDGSHGTIDVDWPDAVKPLNGAASCLKFAGVSQSGGVAGIQYEGLFPGGTDDGKLVYLTFPFETVYPEDKRTELLAGAMDFFASPVKIDGNSPAVVRTFSLAQNYPNPFNPATTIKYQMPQSGHVELMIFDLAGHRVKTLENQLKSSGTYTATWHAGSIASGVYFYQLHIYNPGRNQLLYSARKKCILLK